MDAAHGTRRGLSMFDWLFPRTHAPSQQEVREAADRAATRQDARDLIDEIKETVAALQATADDDRKGYPIASGLKRRRVPDG